MPYTKCPSCRKVQKVAPVLVAKDVGCMAERCGRVFKAEEYRMHSGPLSKVVFWFVIGFGIFMLGRWLWSNAGWIIHDAG